MLTLPTVQLNSEARPFSPQPTVVSGPKQGQQGHFKISIANIILTSADSLFVMTQSRTASHTKATTDPLASLRAAPSPTVIMFKDLLTPTMPMIRLMSTARSHLHRLTQLLMEIATCSWSMPVRPPPPSLTAQRPRSMIFSLLVLTLCSKVHVHQP
jgi:hypothetical protein